MNHIYTDVETTAGTQPIVTFATPWRWELKRSTFRRHEQPLQFRTKNPVML